VLFSRQNGLFTYSPILYGSVIGSFLAFKNRKVSAPALLLIAFFTVYVFSSWWQWFFGGCYGARSFVDFTPFYALGLGFLYQYLYEKPRKILFYLAILLSTIAIFYSLQMTYLYVWPWMGDEWTAQKFWWTVGKAFYIHK
jgi:hypothetical protein